MIPNKGDRIKLIHTSDPYTRLKPGDEGTVTLIDDIGTVSAKWDDGSTLGLNEKFGDRFEVVERAS